MVMGSIAWGVLLDQGIGLVLYQCGNSRLLARIKKYDFLGLVKHGVFITKEISGYYPGMMGFRQR